MNLNNYTQKSQEAILQAQHIAEDHGHQAIEPAHLLLALMTQEEGIVPAIVNKVAGSAAGFARQRSHRNWRDVQKSTVRTRRWGWLNQPQTCSELRNGMQRACRTITSPPNTSCSV